MQGDKPAPIVVLLMGHHLSARTTEILASIEREHAGSPLFLFTNPEIAKHLGPLPYTVWNDGGGQGAGRFLAQMRRLSWVGASHIYDLDPCFLTKLMRILVRPRPKWVIWNDSGEQ